MSLAADLCLDQLAGALAHEMGHAAQAAASPSTRVIWGVSAWFSRVALDTDAWDEWMLHRFEMAGPWRKSLLRCAQAVVAPGRAVARFLLMAESAVSSPFLRRMELEADRCQLRVAGLESFISTILETNLLAVASQRAMVDLSRMWRERRLVDDYPGLVVFIRRHYSPEFVQRLQAGLEEGKTGIFSPHPSDKDRIAFARAEGNPGTLPTGLPAAALFTDYGARSREVTLEYYDQDLRLERSGCELNPIQKHSLF
jgi:Zn-dependent protease with chaperone function